MLTLLGNAQRGRRHPLLVAEGALAALVSLTDQRAGGVFQEGNTGFHIIKVVITSTGAFGP